MRERQIHERIAALCEELAAAHRELASTERASSAEPKRWVKLRELAVVTGLSESVLRRHLQDGMPHKRFGGRSVRVNVEAAQSWLEAKSDGG